MTALLFIAIYAGLLVFVIGCIRRVYQYAALPAHLRWELYPVPHEPAERASHGGSYYEQTEWWTKPRHLDRVGELLSMFSEIFLLQTVRRSNRPLWWRSLLFHSGLFAVAASAAITLIVSIIPVARVFANLPTVLGRIGVALILVGALSLLLRRILNVELRDYTSPADYVHLGAIAVTAALLLAGSFAPTAPTGVSFIRAALSFDTTLRVTTPLALGILFSSVLLAYIPFSRMAHFIGKYFAYHSVRWDDAPNRNAPFSALLKQNLSLRPTWSASHIGADGNKSWADIATANPTAEVRK